MPEPDAPKPQPNDGDELTDARIEEMLAAGVPGSTRLNLLSWQPPSVEALQAALPHYEIKAFVARGGMGAVYRGVQRALERDVAIKVLPPNLDDGEARFTERFKNEAKAMAKLAHPAIVTVFDAGETSDGLLYFVMEFIEGSDLQQLITSEVRIELQRALAITLTVLDALAFAHESGIIHRDIKPSNVMLDARGRVKVADFGLAKVVARDTDGLTGSGLMLGTADFMAPEAGIKGTKLDARADVYAVGVMLYVMLTGKIPRGRFDAPSTLAPKIDSHLDEIVDKAMRTDREKRFASAAEMKAALEETMHPSAAAASAPVAERRSYKAVAIVGALLLVGAIIAFISTRRLSPAAAPVAKAAAVVPDRWIDAMPGLFSDAANAADIAPENGGKAARVIQGTAHLFPTGLAAPLGDQAVRVTARGVAWGVGVRVENRPWGKGGRGFNLQLKKTMTALPLGYSVFTSVEKKGSYVPLREYQWPAGFDWNASHTIELRAVGNTLNLSLDGQKFSEVVDAPKISAGYPLVWAEEGAVIERFEYADLNPGRVAPAPAPIVRAPTAPAVAASAATKDAPFVNSLGMRFVPVPIKGGPTNGQRVLFSVWLTRVQDYQLFVSETKTRWQRSTSFSQGPTEPAHSLSWVAAVAFCEWLTERERRAGLLATDIAYRLPSDHEWSCAAGIGEREDAALLPAEKKGKLPGVYVWGDQWPPPPGVGNLKGEELSGIAGYRDNFVNTSPVDSFPPNQWGVCDMAGNLAQWCADWFNASQTERVVRGSSWGDYEQRNYQADYRNRYKPTLASNGQGFRCVLAPSAAASEKWVDRINEWFTQQNPSVARLTKLSDGAARVEETNGITILYKPARDAAVRAIVRGAPQHISLGLRGGKLVNNRMEGYAAAIDAHGYAELACFMPGTTEHAILARPKLPGFDPTAKHTLEFRAVGDLLTVFVDGKQVIEQHDSTFTQGTSALTTEPGTIIEKLEYLILDK